MLSPSPARTAGFTLLELLVVVALIAILMALLVPAMDQAIYQAELAVCAANEHAAGNGLFVYAGEFKRYYPHRLTNWMPPWEFKDLDQDIRPVFNGYLDINAALNCPLNSAVDFKTSLSDRVYGDYNMWFGYRYQINGSAGSSVLNDQGIGSLTWEKGMIRVGDKLNYQGDAFDILLSDQSRTGNDGSDLANSSHPDYDGVMSLLSYQDGRAANGLVTFSWWDTHQTLKRGPVDLNFLADDNSVRRYNKVRWDDGEDSGAGRPRMAKLTQDADGRNPALFVHLPLSGQ